jgi:FkbM family methyltransferase
MNMKSSVMNMKSVPASLTIDQYVDDQQALAFCQDFLHGGMPRYVFGRNEYAESIARVVEVDGFIDDFTKDLEFLGKPIIRTEEVPKNAFVVSVVIGRPFVAEKRLKDNGIQFLDYFAFKKYVSTKVAPVRFWEEFRHDFDLYRDRYQWVYSLLQDEESKEILKRIVNFRLSYNLEYMRGFTDAQYRQYFEDFLALKRDGEVFVDVGSFDGYTSLEFIKRCPNYNAIHVFEPEPGNMLVVQNKLTEYPRVFFHPYGLSDRSQVLRFQAQGSCSKISKQGDMEIRVERLDDVIDEEFTFLKMDIEGGEVPALEGAQQAIVKYHPRLAISVYHRADDLWRIPELVLSMRKDYQLYLRHYTEGVDETVMFFIPDQVYL